jgi:hypothetical protein
MQFCMMLKSVRHTIICRQVKSCLIGDDKPANLPSKVLGYKMNREIGYLSITKTLTS